MLKKTLAFFLLLILAGGLVYGAINDTPTYDEPANMAAAYDYVWGGDFRIYPDNPPLVKMLAGIFLLPEAANIKFPKILETYSSTEKFDLYAFGRDYLYNSGNDAKKIIFLSRIPNIIFTLGIGILLYFFAGKLFGGNSGLLALCLYIFDPNIRGHGKILAFDLPLAFFTLLIYIFIFYFVKNKGIKKRLFYGILVSAVFSLAFLTKFTAILVLAITALFLIIYSLTGKGIRLRNAIFLLTAICISVFAGLWGFAGLTNYNNSNGFDYERLTSISSARESLKYDIKWNLINLLPAPHYYKTGMMVMYTHDVVSQPSFLLGEVHAKNDWFFYFPISFLLKTPLPTIILIIISVLLVIKAGKDKNLMNIRDYFAIVFALFFMLAMMLASHINNVYRYMFPTLVFFILASSRLAGKKYQKNILINIIIICMILWLFIASVFSFPYDLSYTNELTGIPAKGKDYLSDSEIDWGQDLERLGKYVKENNLGNEKIYLSYLGTADPKYYGVNYKQLQFEDLGKIDGLLIISVGNLVLGDWQWRSLPAYRMGAIKAPLDVLRSLKPTKIIGKSIYIYDFRK